MDSEAYYRPAPYPNGVVEELDPGIRWTVTWLREKGFDTTDSGDGVSKPSEHRVFDCPHVVILVEEPGDLLSAARRLAWHLRARRVELHPQNMDGLPALEASLDVASQTATLLLTNVSDETLGFDF